MNESDISLICKALSDSNRLKIIKLLTSGEKCACNLLEEFNITQPTLSHHMKILCECNLVETRKDGKWCHYSLNCETFHTFKEYFNAISCCENTSVEKEMRCSCK